MNTSASHLSTRAESPRAKSHVRVSILAGAAMLLDPGTPLLAATPAQAEVQRASQVELSLPGTHEFGSQIALDSSRLLSTSQGFDTTSAGIGRVTVWEKGPQGWAEVDELVPDFPNHTLTYGQALALAGDWAYVGDPNQSRVHIFERTPGGWLERQVLPILDGIPGGFVDLGGSALDVDPVTRRLIVRSRYDDTMGADTGAAYVFDPTPTGYQLSGSLYPPVPTFNTEFGVSVQIDGDRAAVGEPGPFNPTIPAAVHVYELRAGVWTHVDSLFGTNPSGLPSHEVLRLGFDVALEGDRLAAGMVGTLAEPAGAVLTFERDSSGWHQTDYLMIGMTPVTEVGYQVEMFGDQLIVGATAQNTASVFTRLADGTWDERQRLVPASFGAGGTGNFGVSLSFDGSTLALGADWSLLTSPLRSGAVHLYEDLDAPSFGESYCHGDVQLGACPCGLDSLNLDGPGCGNSATSGARLSAGGSASLSAGDLSFRAFGMPTSKPCLLFAGTQDKGAGIPFQNGILCVGGAIRRLPAQSTSIFGDALWTGVSAGLGPIAAGDERFFQAWYRDQNPQCPTGSANLTNGFKLRFEP